MTDYTEVVPPDYRNLALNPSGEEALAATWYGDSGFVVTGSTAATPQAGTGVVQYTVGSTPGNGYYFAPLGPAEEPHHNVFKIPEARTLSARISVASPLAVWVMLQARFSVLDELQALSPITTTNISTPVHLSAGSAWSTIETFVTADNVPEGATHWELLVTVSASDPTLPGALPPAAGTIVFADKALIPDSGADLTGVTWFDGNTAGAYWEGPENYSSSHTGTPEVPPADDPDAIPPDPIVLDDDTLDSSDTLDPPDDPGGVIMGGPRSGPRGEGEEEATATVTVVEPELTAAQRAELITRWKYTPERLCLKGDIQLGNLVFNTVDDDGVVWIVSDLEGWWTLPDPNLPDMPRGWFDGSYDVRGNYQARVFNITGTFIPTNPGSVATARDRLIRASNIIHNGDWFLTHEDATEARTNTKGSWVRLSGPPLITTSNASGRTDFSIALKAPDPVKYKLVDGKIPGWQTTSLVTSNVDFPGRTYPRGFPWKYPEAVFGNVDATLMNYGNTNVWPIFSLKGPTSGPVLIKSATTGQQLRIAKRLYPNEELQINCDTREVTMNNTGNFRFYLDLEVDWIFLAPGGNRLYFTEETPGAGRTSLDVKWRSGWIG